MHSINWDEFISVIGTDKFFDEAELPPPLGPDWNPLPPHNGTDAPDDFQFNLQREPVSDVPAPDITELPVPRATPEVIIIDDEPICIDAPHAMPLDEPDRPTGNPSPKLINIFSTSKSTYSQA